MKISTKLSLSTYSGLFSLAAILALPTFVQAEEISTSAALVRADEVLAMPTAEDENAVKQKFDLAVSEFAKRNVKDPTPINKAIEVLSSIEGKSVDPDMNYDILILESRAYYWRGTHLTDRSMIMAAHEEGQKKADAAKDISEDYAEAYYFGGINLARWAKANGVFPSLSKRPLLEDYYMKNARLHPTRSGDDGFTVDGYGPNRVLGKLYYELPRVFGGDLKKSLTYLEEAYTNAKSVALNAVYYAETLNGLGENKKALGVLNDLLENSPENYNPNRTPETLDDFQAAEDLKKKISHS